jgi:NitT/TauT family transport system permease protein
VIFLGFSAAMLLAIPLGILCGTFDSLAKLTEPFVDFVRYMPPPTFGALMLAIWGLFDAPKIAIIFIGCFFNMVLVTGNTTRTLDVALLEAAQTLGARRLSLITHVIVPGVLPGIYKDIRICLGAAWTFLTAAELVGNMSGLSAFINQQQKHQHFDNVYAGIIVIGLIGFVIDQALAFLGTLLFPWTPEANHKARRWFRWLGFLTSPVEGSHPEPATEEELRAAELRRLRAQHPELAALADAKAAVAAKHPPVPGVAYVR